MSADFESLNLSRELLDAIGEMGYKAPTGIQEKIIPLILEGSDVIGQSSTGTGKTAAFGIPAVELLEENEDRDPRLLVMAPTRELAMQISEELGKFAKYKPGLKIVTVYGGQSINVQLYELDKADIVVGTPGRLIDHIKRGSLELKNIRMVVLDEADEMLDMGFLDDIRYILRSVPKKRQTLLFSATMPSAILRMVQQFQNAPVHVKGDDGNVAFDLINQYFVEVPKNKKAASTAHLIKSEGVERALIFCNTKIMVDILCRLLNEQGVPARAIHGDMSQALRTKVMADFKAGTAPYLIATDVAARGIDATGVDAIINYDIPQDIEFYIHRIGRTGRAGKEGRAYTIMTGHGDFFALADIENMIKTPILPLELEGLDELQADRKESFASAERSGGRERVKPVRSSAAEVPAVLAVDVGSDHDVTAEHIISSLTSYTGIKKRDIGKITVEAARSLIEMSKRNAEYVLANIEDATVNDFLVEYTLEKQGSGEKRSSARRHPRHK